MDKFIIKSKWFISENGSRHIFRIVESDLTHLFYIEKALSENPNYFRRVSKGYKTKEEAMKHLGALEIVGKGYEKEYRKNKNTKSKSKRKPKTKGCGCT